MRILQVGTGFTSIPPQGAFAAERVTHHLSSSLTRLGHEVTVLDISAENRPSVPYELSEVRPLWRSDANLVSHVLRGISFQRAAVRGLHELLEHREYNVVHFHNQFSAAAGIQVAHQHGVPAAYTVHNWIWCRTQACKSALQRLKFILELRALRKADVVVCVSQAVAENLVRYLGVESERIAVVPNGVDDEWFARVPVSASVRAKYKPNDEPLVLNVARIAPYKNQMTLALAIPLVSAAMPGVRFLFVGPVADAVYARKVKRMLAEAGVSRHAVFAGGLHDAELHQLCALSDICVLCSRAEAHPLALLEAMACGKPVIGSDIEPIRETVGEVGITVPVYEHKALADAITSLLQNGAARRKMGQRARQRIAENYRWVNVAERTVALYNQVRAAQQVSSGRS